MKKCIMILGLLGLAVIARADAGFLKTLPADDFSSAGLQKLTAGELARLEALVQLYKTGELTAMRQQAEAEASAAQRVAEQKIIAAEQKAREAEAKAREVAQQARDAEAKASEAARNAKDAAAKEAATKAEAVPGKKQPGWFAALLTLKRAAEKPGKEEPLTSRLEGDFSGWRGHTVFKLQNGTQWVQQNKTDSYVFSPALHSPNVKIKPAALSGFWLEIEGVNMMVRVVPFELIEQK